jgi:PAS domain-containing protein
METLKGIVASPEAKLDHATTIECAIHMIETLRDEVKAADKPSALSKGYINALDGVQISCWNISSSGVILDVNETAAKFAGFTRREMLNRNSSELINARFYVKDSFEDGPPITTTLKDIYKSLMIQDHLMVTFTLIDKSGDYWEQLVSASTSGTSLIFVGRNHQ